MFTLEDYQLLFQMVDIAGKHPQLGGNATCKAAAYITDKIEKAAKKLEEDAKAEQQIEPPVPSDK